jgi:uncharacterized protein with NRDE domain
MCVAAVAWRAHPRWPLVAIGNRDEFHERPSAALARWDDGSGIVAGRDLRSGGTWLGIVPEAARFALVTNVRNPDGPDPAKASRGSLVTDLLTGTGDYAEPARIAPDAFNPFNLLVATPDALTFLSNRPEPQCRTLPPDVYGLSNGTLDEPWPKTLTLKAALRGWLDQAEVDLAPLFAALTDERLPHTEQGLEPATDEAAPWTTPPFIRNPTYGTRCATVLTVDIAGHCTIIERRFDPTGETSGETLLTFAWGQRAPQG